MNDLVFIKRRVGRYIDDVSISVNGKEGAERISIYFRNGIEKMITNDKTDYMVIAILKDRMYFKKSDATEGYKVSLSSGHKEKCCSKRIQISGRVAPSLLKFAKNNEGEFALKYDDDRELHYILCD